MHLTEFLSGHADKDRDYSYLRDLMKDNISWILIKIHVKDLIDKGLIRLVVDRPQGNFFIPSKVANYGGMVFDYSVYSKCDVCTPVIYKDMPCIIYLGCGPNGSGYFTLEKVMVQIPAHVYNTVMLFHYERWRPRYADKMIQQEQSTSKTVESEFEMITLNEQ